MFDHYAGRLYDYLAKRQRSVRSVLLILILISIAGLFFVKYESNMDQILPRDEVITRSMNFFRNSEVTGKVVVSLGLNDPAKDIGELLQAADSLAASLDPAIFTEVTTGVSELKVARDMEGLFRHIPSIVSEDDLAWLEGRVTRQHISEKLRTTYLQLLKPEGIFLGSFVRTDPLGLKMLVMEKVSSLTSAIGYDVAVKDGHFVSRDGRHAMVIAKTPIPVIDTDGGRRLLASLKKTLAGLPPFVSADIFAGHSHSVSNERLIKTDINVISAVATVLFFFLYVVIIRDMRAALIFLVPFVAILLSIPLSYLFLGKISYWVLGLGSTVAGITIDYGTHVFFAASGRSDPGRFVKHVIKPISYGAITSVAVFAAFFFSKIEAYGQMAVFAIICIILSTLLSIFVLPHLLARSKGANSEYMDRAAVVLEHRNWSSGPAVALWLVLTVVFSYYAVHVTFEKNIKKIDGTEEAVIEAEERFHKIWGGENMPAVFVITAPGYEQALELNERIDREAVPAVGRKNFTSIATLWPSEKTRKANEARWTRFWSSERKQRLKELLAEEGKPYGFSPHAFGPFFDTLDHTVSGGRNPDFGFSERFIQKTKEGYQVLSFFPDTPEYTEKMERISGQHPGAYLVSGSLLAKRIAEFASYDLKLMTAIAAVLVTTLTFFAFWNIRETIIAMVPPVTSVTWLLGIMAILGIPVNVANMIAGVLVIGLTSDYGIFMTFRSRDDVRAGTVLAITLCTVTTVLGAGVLFFARHPALFSVGTTMVVGVATGFLASVLVVPKLCELTMKPAVGVKPA